MIYQLIFDIDGVVCDAVSPVLTAIWEQFGIALAHSDVTQFSMHDCLWDSVKHIFASPDAFRKWIWRSVWSKPNGQEAPYWGLWAALRELKEAHSDKVLLKYVTARPSYLANSTEEWLEKWGIKGPVDYCGGADKARLFEAHIGKALSNPQIRVWIAEDKVEVAARVAGFFMNIPEVVVYVPDRPWTGEYWGADTLERRYIVQDLIELTEKL